MTGTDQKSDRNGGDETASARPGPDAEAVAAAAAAIDAEAPVEAAAMAERLAAAEAEAARLKDEYLRALAETENVRRRGSTRPPGGGTVCHHRLRPRPAVGR